MTRSACLIFNPVAGQGDSEKDLATIESLLQSHFELDIQFTTEEVGGGELARRAIANDAKIIIASGGDGTVSAVAEALVETGIPLGTIARGTANAFANALGIPDTIEAACQVIIDGATKKVDAAMCNDKPMILLAGIGFEAETVENADREAKNRLGKLAYVLSGLKQLQEFNQFEATINTEEKSITVEAHAITIANAAPASSILAQGTEEVVYDDGLLDVTIVAPRDRMKAIATSFHLLHTATQNEAAKRDDIGYFRTKWIEVTTNPPQKIVLDGEIIGTTPIKVRCIPEGLTIFTPEKKETPAKEKIEQLPGVRINSQEPIKEDSKEIDLKDFIEGGGKEIDSRKFIE